ncbi:hypothetical protein D4R51_00690 [bacterium]|nr:MAG: hypothetical protein D4R51_00690 [bacterium]
MQKLLRNPLFYTSLVLAILLGFQMYGFVSAAYAPPGGTPPTGGNPAQPLDMSATPQTKLGELTIGYAFGPNGEIVKPNIKIDGDTSGLQTIFFNNNGTDIGEIYYSGKKFMVKNGDGNRFEIGTGAITKIIAGTNVTISPTTGIGNVTINAAGGGAGVGWSFASNNIDVYATTLSGKVSIGSENPLGKFQVTGGDILGRVAYTTGPEYYAEAAQNKNGGIRMIPILEGICFLTHVGGNFQGNSEQAKVIVDSGYWVLWVSAGNIGGSGAVISAGARCVGFPNEGYTGSIQSSPYPTIPLPRTGQPGAGTCIYTNGAGDLLSNGGCSGAPK